MKPVNKFNRVTPKWINKQLSDSGRSINHFANGINNTEVQVYQWLSGNRNPSKSCKAAIYYYFKYVAKIKGL